MSENTIRVICEKQTFFVNSLDEAQEIADKEQLDLVEMAENVYKVMDYQKYLYEQSRNKKKQSKQETKKLQLHLGIAEHDLTRKINTACAWLQSNIIVSITVQLRGREQMRPELGYKLMSYVIEQVNMQLPELHIPQPKLSNGRDVVVTISPRK